MTGTKPTQTPEFGRTASDYAVHRAGFPPSFFAALKERALGQPGSRVLDLGTGTGTIARGLAAMGADVIGIDADAAMLVEARKLATADKLAVEFREAKAEATGLEAESFDIVTAGQCWHWFEPRAVTAEVRRLLKPGGTLIIAHFDWLPFKGPGGQPNVVHATEGLILDHNPDWRGAGGIGVYPLWLHHMKAGGLDDIRTFSYDEDTPYSHAGWRGRIQASAGIAILPETKRALFDNALEALLARDYPADPLLIPHRIWAATAKKPDV